MKKVFTIICLTMIASMWANSGDAIPLSYGTASHTNPWWQNINDVSWSIDSGAYGQTTQINTGQTIKFKIEMNKDHVGTHYADFTKAWVDWGQDGAFDSSDTILFGKHTLLPDENGNLGSNAIPNSPSHTYTSGEHTISSALSGDLWMRVRVTCSHSLVAQDGGEWDDQWTQEYIDKYEDIFNPTGYYYQGEVEEYKLSVVPEPSTVALFGIGLVGLAGAETRRRRKKKAVDNS
ncbi:MAG: PEP-CTERM sorting domain-containing protein [Candidatus Scalindua sp.]|nr:PEP-CTERM sorting domain-containing protein [Candidatus Scalindua sp.]